MARDATGRLPAAGSTAIDEVARSGSIDDVPTSGATDGPRTMVTAEPPMGGDDHTESGRPHRSRREVGPPLAVLTELFEALEQQHVRYCHWKSTTGIPRGLSGLTDLDLLVDRTDAARFRSELERLTFKRLISGPGAQYPGLEDYLGFDDATGKLVHLHVHYRLVLGAEHVKNHLLPIESAFLDTTHREHGVRVPEPALEAAILAVRVLLKAERPSLVARLTGRSSDERASAHVAGEFADLRPRYTDDEMAATLARHLAFVPPDLILHTIAEAGSARPSLEGADRSDRLRRALRPYQRTSAMRAGLRGRRATMREGRILGRILRPLLPPRRRKTLGGGGLSIAFIGSDGSGKSTVVREVAAWLSWRLDVRTAYMGTNQPSTGARLWRAISQWAARADAALRRIGGRGGSAPGRMTARMRHGALSARYLADGRDRHRRSMNGRRLVGQGWVVLFDRYPLPGALVRGRPIDGGRITRWADRGFGRHSMSRAARAEEQIYAGIVPPDLTIVLRVSPDVAAARKPDHDRAVLAEKAASIADIAATCPGVVVIDADAPLDQVLLEVKQAIWRRL
jgi:thymidylate kinase